MAFAVFLLSPVSIMVFMPIALNSAIDSMLPSLILSATAIIPMSFAPVSVSEELPPVPPLTPIKRGVAPFSARASISALAWEISILFFWKSFSFPAKIFRPEASAMPEIPKPCSALKSLIFKASKFFSLALFITAFARGCSERTSRL